MKTGNKPSGPGVWIMVGDFCNLYEVWRARKHLWAAPLMLDGDRLVRAEIPQLLTGVLSLEGEGLWAGPLPERLLPR